MRPETCLEERANVYVEAQVGESTRYHLGSPVVSVLGPTSED